MKNLFKNLMLVAVAAMAFTACTETNDEVNAVVEKTVLTFTANFDEDTRAAFGDKNESGYYPASWEGGEQVRFVAPAADYDGTYEAYAEAVKLGDDGKSATFEVVFNYPIKAGTVYAYLGSGWNTITNYAYVDNYQTPEANTVDKDCLMASASFEYDGESMDFSGKFSHGAAYGKMTINGFDGKNISYVEVELNGEPENHTYTLDVADLSEHTYWFATEAINVTSFTVTATVDEVSYSKTIDMEGKSKPLAFNIGEVSKFSVSDLAKDPVVLDMPSVSASFDAGEVTVSWNAVENADSYSVWVDSNLVAEDIKTTSYVFDADYTTYYYIEVTANAAEGSVDYVDSYKSSTSITTPMDIDNMEVNYTVALTGYTINNESSYGKQFVFTSSDATKRINLPVNPNLPDELPAGVYSAVYGSWSFSDSAALEFNWYDTQYWYTSIMDAKWCSGADRAAVKVTREDNGDWSITIIVENYEYGYVKYVYSETTSQPGTGAGESIEFPSDAAMYKEVAWESTGDTNVLKLSKTQHGDSNYLRLYFNAADCPNNNSIKVGTYNIVNNQNPAVGEFAAKTTCAGSCPWWSTTVANMPSSATLQVNYVDGKYQILMTKNAAESHGYEGMPECLVAPSEGGESGGEEPEPDQPGGGEEPEPTPDPETPIAVSWSYVVDTSNSGTYGHMWSVSSGDDAFFANVTMDSRSGYSTSTSFTPGVFNYHAQYADGNYGSGMWFTMRSIKINGTEYSNYDVDGTITVTNDGGVYTLKMEIYKLINGYRTDKLATMVGTI